MAIEAGGKNGVIPADDITTDYVDARNAGDKPYEIFHADSNVRLFKRFICHEPAFVCMCAVCICCCAVFTYVRPTLLVLDNCSEP